MAVKIRLMRVGKTKQPTYRVVVADGRKPRDGRFIEIIGQYGPRQDPSLINIDGDRALAWLRQGAQPTDQVQKLLTVTGVWEQFASERKRPAKTKLNRRGYATGRHTGKKTAKNAPAEAPAAAVPAPAPDAAAAPETKAPAPNAAAAANEEPAT